MKIERYNIKSSSNCSVCGNKSNKKFELVIIEINDNINSFMICDKCQKITKLESENFIFKNDEIKFNIG